MERFILFNCSKNGHQVSIILTFYEQFFANFLLPNNNNNKKYRKAGHFNIIKLKAAGL